MPEPTDTRSPEEVKIDQALTFIRDTKPAAVASISTFALSAIFIPTAVEEICRPLDSFGNSLKRELDPDKNPSVIALISGLIRLNPLGGPSAIAHQAIQLTALSLVTRDLLEASGIESDDDYTDGDAPEPLHEATDTTGEETAHSPTDDADEANASLLPYGTRGTLVIDESDPTQNVTGRVIGQRGGKLLVEDDEGDEWEANPAEFVVST
jgi:hypothetical protein